MRLEAVTRAGFDARLARLDGGRLTRAAGVIYLETGRPFEDVRRDLALAGVRATRCDDVPAPAVGQRASLVLDLTPLADTTPTLDIVDVRSVPLGQALSVLSRRRPPFFRSSQAARTSCRRLLREEDEVLAWRRVIWCSLASLRGVRRHVPVRPIVFDRTALQRHAPRWSYVSAGELERWAFA